MSTGSVIRKYVWQAAAFTVLVVVLNSAFVYAWPQHYFAGYSLIPVFFFALGIFAVNVTEKCRMQTPQRLSQMYLLMRMLRMMLSLIVMVVYSVAVGKVLLAFFVMFVANYLLYLIFDSWFFYRYERRGAGNDKMENK